MPAGQAEPASVTSWVREPANCLPSDPGKCENGRPLSPARHALHEVNFFQSVRSGGTASGRPKPPSGLLRATPGNRWIALPPLPNRPGRRLQHKVPVPAYSALLDEGFDGGVEPGRRHPPQGLLQGPFPHSAPVSAKHP